MSISGVGQNYYQNNMNNIYAFKSKPVTVGAVDMALLPIPILLIKFSVTFPISVPITVIGKW